MQIGFRQSIGIVILMCIALTMLAACANAQESTKGVSEAKIREIAEAYTANRAKFKQYVMRFTHRIGVATSEANARAGKLDKVTCTAEVKWAFDGKRTCFVKTSADGSVQREVEKGFANAKDGYATAPMSEEIVYSAPGVAFNFCPGAASFYVPVGDHSFVGNTPFDIGFMGNGEKASIAADILRLMEAKMPVQVKTVSEADDRFVHLEYERRGGYQLQCWLDPEKGHSIRKAAYQRPGGELPTQIYVIQSLRCDNDAWMPGHVVKFHEYKGQYHVHQWKVVEMNCGQPEELDFVVTLPRGTQVNGPVPNTAFNLEVDTIVNEAKAREYMAITEGKLRISARPK